MITEPKMGLVLFGVIALVAGTLAGPIQEVRVSDTCARQCTVSNQFNYETGTTYEFTYETELRTAVQGASEDHAGIHLKSKAYLDFISKCEMVLRLDDVTLMEHDPETGSMKPVKTDLVSELERNPLTVSFQDGNIEELCLSKPESDEVLNIKRGVLSLIQNNMDDINADQTVTESDVSGECEAEYTSEDKGWYNKLIKKSKNLLGCKQRSASNIAVDSIPYTADSDIQSVPLIKSTHECEQEITTSTGRLQYAKCHEQHRFAPFSRLDSGAITLNTQTLTFVKEFKSSSRPVPVIKRVPIQFQHEGDNDDSSPIKEVEQKLMDICADTKNGVSANTPNLFTSLVKTMKTMKSSDMTTVYKNIQKQQICSANNNRVRKYFLDAIPMCGTVDSVRYMVQLLSDGEITGLEADMWMTTLSFIQRPSIAMLAEVKPLLAMTSNQEKAMLSVSSLIHRVCKTNPECSNLIEVKKLISLMENKIAPSCKVTDDTLQMSVLALRAIGNAGFGEGAITTLSKCIQRTENPIEIRLSAIQAFRRMSCSTDKSTVFAVFSNTEEDSEVRIAAYKTLMECPSDDLIRQVKGVLAGEVVNQVGSYVWSHLTNLMETSDPHKQSIRTILEDEALKKEFDLDQRKFSRNYEKSLFIEKLNTGATAEADLIWSSQSFIPRSGMLNLTIDLFGNAVNLFEVGGRMEGLEYFLESYFGPSGYFSEQDVEEAVVETSLDIVKSDKIKRIDTRNSQPMDDLRGSLYMKVFGNELRYVDFQGLDSLMSKNSINILDIITELSKENDYQYTHSSIFMDSSLVVPTSSGFPLKLTVNGTSTIDLKASGMVDVMKLASTPPTMDVHGLIKPSGAIVVSSSMGIDALGTQNGIKMVSTLHSSTSVQGKISLAQGSILSVEFDMPEEKQDIISVSSSFYTVHRHSEREQKMITDNRQEHIACTGKYMAKISGLELCGEVNYPNASMVENAPYFPMTGPVNAAITLYKRDSSMKGYKMEARSIHDNDVNIVRFAFSTPDSSIDRSFGADISLNKAAGSVDASFTSPWKKADFTGSLINDRMNKVISGKLNYNGELQFDVKGSLQSEKSGPGMIYTPSISVSVPGMMSSELTGSVNYAAWKYFITSLKISGLTSTPITLKSTIQNKANIQSASASIEVSPKQQYSFDSSIKKIEYPKKISYESQLSIQSPTKELLVLGGSFTNVFGKNTQVDFIVDKIVATPITMKTNFITKSFRRGRVQNIIRTDLRSQMVELKMRNKFDNRNGKTLAVDFDITYVIRRVARDNIKLVGKLINLSTKTLTKGKSSLNFASKRYPYVNFKMLSNLNHNQRLSGIEADISYGEDFKNAENQISMTVSLGRAIKSISEASATLNGKLLVGQNFRLISKVDHAHNTRSLDSNVMLRLNKDALTASLSLKNNTAEKKNIYGELQLDFPGKSISFSHLLDEPESNVYSSTLNAKIGKSKNTIMTTIKKSSPSEFSLSSSVNISPVAPFTVKANCNTGPDMYKLGGSVQLESNDKYSTDTTLTIKTGSVQLTNDISCPTRHIISSLEGTKSGNKYTSRADVRWNAERDDTQRITWNANGQMSGLNDVDGSITIQYPGRTLAATLRNNVGNKVSTYARLQWEPTQIITIDTTYGLYTQEDLSKIVGSLKLSSPFSILQQLDVDVNHQISETIFKTNVDVEWNSKGKSSGTLSVRRPLTMRDVDIDFLGKAPMFGYKTLSASLNHHINTGLSTIGKITLNRQSMQIDISMLNKGDATKTDLTGQIDLKTTFRNLKSASAKVAYGNDGRKMSGSALVDFKKQSYGIQTSMTNKFDGFNLRSEGEIILSLPSDTITSSWEHKHTSSEITTKSETTWDNKKVYINLNGIQDMSLPKGKMSAALEIQSPLDMLSNIVFHINHAHTSGQIDSSMKFASSGNELANVEYKYLNANQKLTSSLTATNPVYDGTVSTVFTSSYGSTPMTANLEMSLTPLQTYTIGASLDMKDTSDIDASISITIPNTPVITLSASRKQQRSYVDSSVSVEYQPGQVIRLDSTHRTGAIKQMKLKFTSPFTTDYSAEGVFQKGDYSIRSNAMVVAEPYISQWSVSGSIDVSNGINGNVKLNTPYPEMPYSEISVLSEVVDGSTQSSVVIEYLPGKTIKISGLHNINSLNDIKLTIDLTTPFDALPFMAATFRHNGDWQQFSNFGEVEYPKGEKTTVEIKHMINSGLQSSISVRTPFTEDMMASINHNGYLNNFESHGEITFGSTYIADLKHTQLSSGFGSSAKLAIDKSEVDGSIQFSFDPKIVTSISLNTPFENFRKVRLSQTFEGTPSNFSGGATVSMSDFGTYSAYINSNIGSKIAMDISIQTPVKGYRDLKAAFTHQGPLSSFNSRMELQNGLSQYFGNIKFASDPAINLDAVIRTPYESISLGKMSLTLEGVLNNFKLISVLQKNKEVSQVELLCNVQRKYDIDLTIKSPYAKTIKASFDHWGSMKKFQTKFNYRCGRDKITSSAQFALQPSMNAVFAIKSPFAVMKNIQLSLRHAGSSNSFKSNMDFKQNGKSYTGVASFQNQKAMTADLTLKGPTFRPINIAVSHEGQVLNFKSSAEMSMGKDAIQIDAALNTLEGIKGALNVATPFDAMNSLYAAVSHTGDLSNFKCNCQLNYNKQSGQFDLAVDSTNGLTATTSLSTPFNGFEDMSASIAHSGSADNFNTIANYRQNGKSLESQVGFKSSPSTSGSISIKSGFDSIGNYDGAFNFDGDMTKLSTSGQVNINGQRSSANFDMDSLNGFEAKLGAKSPLFDDTDVYFKHSSTEDAINTQAYVAQNDVKQYSIQSVFNGKSDLGATVGITTPHEGYESMDLAFHHSGSLKDFRSDAEIQLFGEKYECDIAFTSIGQIRGSIALKSPLSEDIGATILMNGTPFNFNSEMSYLYGKVNQLQTRVTLNLEGPLSGDLKIISPLFRNIKASFKHEGDIQKFASEATFIYAGESTDCKITFKSLPDVETSLSLSTPLFKDIALNFHLSGPATNFKTGGSVKYDGQSQVDFDGDFLLDSSMKANLQLMSVLPSLNRISTTFSHTGDLSGFSCNGKLNVNEYSANADVRYSPTSGSIHIDNPYMEDIDGSYSFDKTNGKVFISAPFIEDLTASYDVQGDNVLKADSEGRIQYGSTKVLGVSGSVNYPKSVQIEVQTPIAGYETTRGSYKRNGQYGGNGVLEFNGIKHEAGITLNMHKQYSASAFIDSPMAPAMSMKGVVDGSPATDLSGHFEIIYESDKHEMDVELASASTIKGSLIMNSPLISELRITLDSNKDIDNLESNGAITYASNNIVSVQGKLENSLRKSASISIIVPGNAIKLASTFNGDITSFTAQADASYNEKEVSSSVKFQLQPFATSLTLKSPGNAIRLSSTFNGEITDFSAQADASYNGNEVSSTVNFQLQPFKVSVVIPGNTIKLASTFNGEITDFTAQADASYNDKEVSSTVNFQLQPFKASVSLKAPGNDLRLSSSFNGDLTAFNAQADASYNEKEASSNVNFQLQPFTASASLKSPFTPELRTALSYNRNGNICKGQGEIFVDNEKSSVVVTGSARPLKVDISANILSRELGASLRHDGSLTNFQTSSKLNVDSQRWAANANFNMESDITGSFGIETPVTEPIYASLDNVASDSSLRNVISVKYGESTPFSSNLQFSTSPLKATADIKTPIEGFKTISAVLSHSGQTLNFNNHAELTIEDKKMGLDASFNFDSLNGRVSAFSPYFPTLDTGFEFSGNGGKFSAKSDFSYGSNKYSLETTVVTLGTYSALVTIKTPVAEYKKITTEIRFNGQIPNVDSFAQIMVNRREIFTSSGKVNTDSGITVEFAVQSAFTPAVQINLKHMGELSNLVSNGEIRVDGVPSTATIMFATTPSMAGSVDIKSPYIYPVYGSIDLKRADDSINAHAEGKLGTQIVTFDGTAQYGDNAGISVSLVTPIEGFERMQSSVQYKKQYKGFTATIDMQYPGGRIQSEARSNWRSGITSSISLKTPFESLRNSEVEFTLDNEFPSIGSELNVLYAGQKYHLKGDLKDTNIKIVAATPFAGFEDVSAEFKYQGPASDMQTSTRIVYMTGKEISASLQNTLTDMKLVTKAKLETPYTEELNVELLFNGESTDFSNVLSISMGEDNAVSTTALKIGESTFDFDTSLQSVFAGYTADEKVVVSLSGIIPNAEATVRANILGSNYFLNTNFKVEDSTSGSLVIRTPISHFEDVDFSFEHTGSLRRFTTKSSLQYDTNKKIEGSLQYMKYGWRRLQTIMEVKTPFTGFDVSKFEYRHIASVDSFECNSDLSFMDQDFSGTVRASMSPIMATISVTTPFTDFEKLESNMKLNYGSFFIDFDGNVQYMRDSTISLSTSGNIESDPQVFDLKLATPFPGYESFSLTGSNTGSLSDFLSEVSLTSSFIPDMRAQANMKYISPLSVDGSITFNSQINNLESISLSLKNAVQRGQYQTKIETSWAPNKSIIMNGEFKDNRYSMDANLEILTPFEIARQVVLRSETVNRGTIYSEKLTVKHNGQIVTDSDLSVDMGYKKAATITIRKPIELLINVYGSADSKYQASVTVSKDVTDLTKAFKINGMYDPSTKALSLQHSCPEMSGRLDGTLSMWNNNVDLLLNGVRYGYQMDLNDNDGQVKLVLPTRSILAKGSKSASTIDGSFMWDADRDETAKVGFRSVIGQSKADITIMMPSIGKEVQIDSQISMNKGRVLFDGKTEVVYSRDASKKITMMAKLEDITDSWSSKNYSFTFGISHPYTSVDVQLASSFGKSAEKITGGMNMKYLTANQDTKTFSINGEIDGSNNIVFNMDTPMKKININGNVKKTSPYQLALTNKYDSRRPLRTIATFDPVKRSASFEMNYDLDNPSSAFYLEARYVNSSAVAAEMYHVANRQRVTDAMLALRLNTSTLLHSRIHWRPDMINDLNTFYSKKALSYSRQLQNDMNVVMTSLDEEMTRKSQLISRAVVQELKPVTDKVADMYNNNEYHLRDITDIVSQIASNIMMKVEELSEVSEENLRLLASNVDLRLSSCMDKYRSQIQGVVLNMRERSNVLGGMYKNYTDYVYQMTPSVPDYSVYMNNIDTSKVANLYTSTIYGAREAMNNGLSVLKANKVYQQGENAYKYWEIQENIEMIVEEIADWIRREIEHEIADIKATVLNTIKSEITVLDIKNGEIQAEIHLPIPVKSLDVMPKVEIDYMPYLTKVQKSIPSMPSVSVPSTLLPPFEGAAKIQGNTVTTFDGLTYDLESSCTYLLARDNTDYNFTVVLNKQENNKTLVIAANGKSFKIYSNGKVSINDQVMELPVVLKDTIVTSLDGRVSVSVAGHITAEFYPEQDLYVVKLNGYYFGKTNGLFGSYDNEPSNDMLTSYGKSTKSVDRFAKTWDVGTERCL